MSHRCFISFKKEDAFYKNEIVKKLEKDRITGKALDKTIDSDDIDYVMQEIRKTYLSNTTVTIFLIGEHSSENEGIDYAGFNKQNFIIRELQASLYNKDGKGRSGILGIVLPNMESKVYCGSYFCDLCNQTHNYVNINDSTAIREFSANYYLLKKEDGCGLVFDEDGRFCVLVRYSSFMQDPDRYIDQAYEKTNQPINDYVHWRDIKHNGK